MTSRIVAVVNQKGGVGKTTTAVNLAASLASSRIKVLLIDLDPQGNATSGFGLDKASLERGSYELITGQASLAETMVATKQHNLSLVPSTTNLAGAEVELVSQSRREFMLKNQLAPASFDLIIIDCPPSLGLLTINALAAASSVLIPVQAEYYALEGLGQLLNTFQQVRAGINSSLELLGVVLTMYDRRNSLAEQVKQEVANYFGDKLFKTTIPRNVRLAEAPGFGTTIFEHDKFSKGARAYKSLAREVAERL